MTQRDPLRWRVSAVFLATLLTLASLTTAGGAAEARWSRPYTAMATGSDSGFEAHRHPYYGTGSQNTRGAQIMRLLYVVRHKADVAQPWKAMSPYVNAAITVADLTGLNEQERESIAKIEVPRKGPLVVYQEVPAHLVRDELPKGAYTQLSGAGTSDLLVIGALSFPPENKKYDKQPDASTGSHSEQLVTRALDRLRDQFHVPLKELAWGSDRYYCQKCRKLVADDAEHYYADDYDLTDHEIGQRAKKVKQAKKEYTDPEEQKQKIKEIRDEYKRLQESRKYAATGSLMKALPQARKAYANEEADERKAAAEKAVQEAGENVEMTHPCPSSNSSQALRLAPLSKSAPCGGKESGLRSALSSPTYGGVDLSTLQLRYLSDTGSGVQYAFSAKAAEKGLEQDSGSGLSALVESMADLRTWLVLSPDKFWVNLNPDEPDRIIDTKLGQTNAGRALLEADWRMKQTQGRLLDPKTSFGAEYWRRLGLSSGQVCYSSRMWIVPGDVQVHEDGDSLYVLKATLNVKAKAEDIAALGQTSCNADPAETARNERLEQELMVPKIVKAVNTDPEYAPLRRAFMARVVAQWIRDRHAGGHSTSFDKLIESGDVGPASLHGSWQPKTVYDAYLRSIHKGDFTYKITNRVGNTTITYTMRTGGVDFSKLNTDKLSVTDMDRQVPGLPQVVQKSAVQPMTASDGSVWLGDRAKAPPVSTWHRISSFLSGRTGILVVLLVALGVLLFFIRDGSAPRRRPSRVRAR